MPGGRLWVTVSPDGVLLEGPVEAVGHFEVDAGWLARHGSAVVSNR
jgi:hypothetical protein